MGEEKQRLDVDSGGKKREVKMGVEKMFDVKVDSVKMMKYKGKKKGMGGQEGYRNKRGVGMVRLKEGEIELFK